MVYTSNGVRFECDVDIDEQEADNYTARAAEKGYNVVSAHVDGDEIELTYENVPFERVRRITGYLVGTLDRFNDGKRAEEADRVKHPLN